MIRIDLFVESVALAVEDGTISANVAAEVIAAAIESGEFFLRRQVADVISFTEVVAKGPHKYGDEEVITLENFRYVSSKAFAEALGTADLTSVFLSKSFSEAKVVSDAHSKVFGKAKADLAIAVDVQAKTTTKPRVDAVDAADVSARLTTKPRSDAVGVVDVRTSVYGLAKADTADVSDVYTASKGKVLADSVATTDDMNGASVDDDQNVQFLKTLTHLIATSDVLARTVSFSRAPSESLSLSEDIASAVTKAPIADAAATADDADRATTKPLTDVADASDAKVIAAVKALIEQAVSASDVASRQASKVLAEAADAADAGRGFHQSYALEDYFAEEYVGTAFTF